jgi:holo-[acyl-carrier protein] synthase
MAALLGTGIDLVEIERFQNVLKRYGERFLSRIYTECERNYCRDRRNFHEHLAARFCAKEAVRKAFGNFSSSMRWLEVEVENDIGGKPVIKLSGKARALADSIGIKEIFVTISHSRRYAVAQAILLK